MRYLVSLVAMLIAVGFAMNAQGADKQTAKEVSRLATEVQGKIVSKTHADVKVEARGCWLHIEFASNNVAFDLPLQGTQIAVTDLNEALVLENRHMKRTFAGRSPENFEKLILKFGKINSDRVKQSFEKAINACGTSQAGIAEVPHS